MSEIDSATTKTIVIDGKKFRTTDVLGNCPEVKPLKLRCDGGYIDLIDTDGMIVKCVGYFSQMQGTLAIYAELGEVTDYIPSTYRGDRSPTLLVKVDE